MSFQDTKYRNTTPRNRNTIEFQWDESSSPERHGTPTYLDRDGLNAVPLNAVPLNALPLNAVPLNRQLKESQNALMKRQDQDLDQLGQSVRRIKEISCQIGNEIDKQSPLIKDLQEDVDETSNKMKSTNKKVKEVHRKTKSSCLLM